MAGDGTAAVSSSKEKKMPRELINDVTPEDVSVHEAKFEGVARRYFNLARFTHVSDNRYDGDDGVIQCSVAARPQGSVETACKVYLPHDSRCTVTAIASMPAFKHWLTRLLHNLALQDNPSHVFHTNPYRLKTIDLQAPTWFPGDKLGFLKAQCTVETDGAQEEKKQWLPGAVFLRGGSVAVLIIIQPYDEEEEESTRVAQDSPPELFSILTLQPRIAAGSLAFAELPAGMLDDSGDLRGKASQEIKEEVGLSINEADLFNMSKAALHDVHQQPYTNMNETMPSEWVADSMYPSPGGCDEFIPLMLVQKRMSRKNLESLQSRKTGLRDQGEVITLKIVPFNDLWREGGRDAKCLAALGLYENLKRVGNIPKMPARPNEPLL